MRRTWSGELVCAASMTYLEALEELNRHDAPTLTAAVASRLDGAHPRRKSD